VVLICWPSSIVGFVREPKLEPKHKIFLSHSGVQKNFTEQLCVDFESWDYWPFFDKRRDSLPEGRKFPELIFRAAQQCRVAILVLSEDFFTRSKWPMLELEAFVQAEKNNPGKLSILPVYLGLSRHECTRNETRRKKWLSVWRRWSKTDDRIDVGKWEDALKVLGRFNGISIEYTESLGEVALRTRIVNAVCRLIPPESSWSGGDVQGRMRILEVRNHCECIGYECECSWTMQGMLAIVSRNMVYVD